MLRFVSMCSTCTDCGNVYSLNRVKNTIFFRSRFHYCYITFENKSFPTRREQSAREVSQLSLDPSDSSLNAMWIRLRIHTYIYIYIYTNLNARIYRIRDFIIIISPFRKVSGQNDTGLTTLGCSA